MPGIGQSVAAAMTQHMEMHLVVGKAGAAGNVPELLVDRIPGERAAALGLEDE